jgi:hypothetical protein
MRFTLCQFPKRTYDQMMYLLSHAANAAGISNYKMVGKLCNLIFI